MWFSRAKVAPGLLWRLSAAHRLGRSNSSQLPQHTHVPPWPLAFHFDQDFPEHKFVAIKATSEPALGLPDRLPQLGARHEHLNHNL